MPEGLTIRVGWLSPGWEAWLVKQIGNEPLQPGSKVDHARYPSRVARYGVRSYGNGVVSSSLPRWSEVLRTIHPRVEFNHLTVNCYAPGDGIAPHIDRADCGDAIHVLSLVSDAPMIFSPPDGPEMLCHCAAPGQDECWHPWHGMTRANATHHVLLAARSMLTLEGDARWHWRHSIPPVGSPRISIVLRQVRSPIA